MTHNTSRAVSASTTTASNTTTASGEQQEEGEGQQEQPPHGDDAVASSSSSSSMLNYLRRLSRNASKAWKEIMTRDEEEQDLEQQQHRSRGRGGRLVVNPNHHLRSHSFHSLGSFHSHGSGDLLLHGNDDVNDEDVEANLNNNTTQDHWTDRAATFLLRSAGGRGGHGVPSTPSTTRRHRRHPSLGSLAEPLLLDDLHGGTGGEENRSHGSLSTTGALLVVQTPLRRRTQSSALLSLERRQYIRSLIRRAGNYLAYATLLSMLCLVPAVVYNQGFKNRRIDSAALRSAGVMAAGTVVLSLRLVYLHLTHWYMPSVQKYVVRILWMVPIYAIQSWLSLWFRDSRLFIDTVRDYYEAFVIASFVYYLIELLGGEQALIQILQAKQDYEHTCHLGRHSFPFSLILDEWELGSEFMLNCKHGVLQYVIFKSIAAFVTFCCASVNIYGEGKFTWFNAYPYLCFFQNVSVMYALYCLVLFFSAVNEELRFPINWRPLGKFLCIKGVVFFTWWQGVVIFYLKDHGIINAMGGWSSEQVAYGLIDYCVVIEMVGFAIAHSYTFTYQEYLPTAIPLEFRYPNGYNNNINNNSGGDAMAGGPEEDNGNNNHNGGPLCLSSSLPSMMDHSDAKKDAAAAATASNTTTTATASLASATVLAVVSAPKTAASLLRNDNVERSADNGNDGDGGAMDDPNHSNMRSASMSDLSLPSQPQRQTTTTQQRVTAYIPPATLDRPMDFRDAFWSSTVPKETLHDIQQQLQASAAPGGALRPRVFSLPKVGIRTRTRSNNEVPNTGDSEEEEEQEDHHVVDDDGPQEQETSEQRQEQHQEQDEACQENGGNCESNDSAGATMHAGQPFASNAAPAAAGPSGEEEGIYNEGSHLTVRGDTHDDGGDNHNTEDEEQEDHRVVVVDDDDPQEQETSEQRQEQHQEQDEACQENGGNCESNDSASTTMNAGQPFASSAAPAAAGPSGGEEGKYNEGSHLTVREDTHDDDGDGHNTEDE